MQATSPADIPAVALSSPVLPLRRLDILVVEDEHDLRDILVAGLAHYGHRVRSAGNGLELDALLSTAPAEMVILDVGLPGEDGYAIATRLRHHWQGGIIMATGRGEVEQRVHGLNTGADLYLTKPVDLRELAAAVDSVARRLPLPAATSWRLNGPNSTLHPPRGGAIPLTGHECLLLRPLLDRPGENIPRAILFQALDYPDNPHGGRRLETLVSRLRAKLRARAPGEPLPLRGRNNQGYAFLADGPGN